MLIKLTCIYIIIMCALVIILLSIGVCTHNTCGSYYVVHCCSEWVSESNKVTTNAALTGFCWFVWHCFSTIKCWWFYAPLMTCLSPIMIMPNVFVCCTSELDYIHGYRRHRHVTIFIIIKTTILCSVFKKFSISRFGICLSALTFNLHINDHINIHSQ